MKDEDITFGKEILEYMADDVKFQLFRLGINVSKVEFTKTTDYKGDRYLKLMTTPFPMTPIIFKEIHIEGGKVNVEEGENGRYTDVSFTLHFRYTHFDNGTNGCTLGSCEYHILPYNKEDLSWRPVFDIVRKIHGITL